MDYILPADNGLSSPPFRVPEFYDDSLGIHTYHEKTSSIYYHNVLTPDSFLVSNKLTGDKDGLYLLARQKWAESRSIAWTLKNKRPERLKENLTEVEELIQTFRIVQVKWRNSRFFQVLLSNCALISFMVAKSSGDVEKIFIDKSLCGRIADKINTGVWADDFMLLSFRDKPKLCCFHFARKLPTDFRKIDKLTAMDPKVTFVDLPGQSGRRLNRCLSLNAANDMVSIWWSLSSEEAWPWSPVAGDRARANLIIIEVNSGKFDVLAYLRTDCDPIYALFSSKNPKNILTVESTPKNEDDNSIDSCVYEFHQSAVTKVSTTSVPLKAAVSCLAWNKAEDKLLLGCKDKTLVLYDCHRLLTQITTVSFVPCKITWHPAGSVVFVFSLHGDIKVFDMALAPVLLQLAAEDPSESHMLQMSEYFGDIKIKDAVWSCDSPLSDGEISCADSLFMVFEDGNLLCNLRIELGSLTLGRLGPTELIEEYIKHDQAEQAVNFVNSINWNSDGNSCFVCLSAVMSYLLKFPLTDDKEGLLEETLGCFYTPSRPINDVVVLQYRDPLSRWSRRFFYHLLRYKKFQKAFMLAVDIGAADLFMDMHFVALDSGNVALAENCKNKALEIDSELLSTESDSYSEVEYEERISFDRANNRLGHDALNELERELANGCNERISYEQDDSGSEQDAQVGFLDDERIHKVISFGHGTEVDILGDERIYRDMMSEQDTEVDISDDEKICRDIRDEQDTRVALDEGLSLELNDLKSEHDNSEPAANGMDNRHVDLIDEGDHIEQTTQTEQQAVGNTAYLPLNTNITQNPDVWALAHNIDLFTTENEEEDVIYL